MKTILYNIYAPTSVWIVINIGYRYLQKLTKETLEDLIHDIIVLSCTETLSATYVSSFLTSDFFHLHF